MCVTSAGEEEIFQVKKPSYSKRIVKQLKKETLLEKDDSSYSAAVHFDVSYESSSTKVFIWLKIRIM